MVALAAAATGIMTTYGPGWSLLVPAVVCAAGAVLLSRTPARATQEVSAVHGG
ncbi:hypothetical protein ABZV93_00145 [Actinopolymorpha sp. NPDC004070]|uniref:hypothetical protein n=1 Tax=Actinopolymorpha sp. NPDC004070 TaxID=3154548 RepID=UPI0033BF70A4